MNSFDDIDVLLATYNGEFFLEEFLDSLAAQEHVNIHLIVSDDGSTDSTLETIKCYQSKFKRVTILHGPKKGPTSNFFYLLRASEGSFIALADQDDIWNKHHLKNSIDRIRNNKLPTMTYSAVEEFNHLNTDRTIWPTKYRGPEFPAIIFENTARGCTFVLNQGARELVNLKEPKNAIMHDWWILLLLQVYGQVFYEPKPEIQYRLHSKNFVGVPTRRTLRFIETLKQGRWLPLVQLRELLDYPDSKFQKIETFDLDLFAKNLQGDFFLRFRRIVCARGIRYRQSLTGEIKIRIGVIFLKALNRRGALRDI
jgi:glycosyltransferase involved in cell wall biosynthesis